eukprot:g10157.t1
MHDGPIFISITTIFISITIFSVGVSAILFLLLAFVVICSATGGASIVIVIAIIFPSFRDQILLRVLFFVMDELERGDKILLAANRLRLVHGVGRGTGATKMAGVAIKPKLQHNKG